MSKKAPVSYTHLVLPACVLDEVRYQLRVVIADRNDDSVIGDNADGTVMNGTPRCV